jgi:hypothetical protein
MNAKRLILAIVVVFVGIFITDFLIHGLWLKADYDSTMSLWRSEAEMQSYMGWMMAGQFLAAVTFTVLYALGFASKRCPGYACLYGLAMGLFMQANTFIMYAVQPLPLSLAIKWIAAGGAQAVVIGLLVYFVYKPR